MSLILTSRLVATAAARVNTTATVQVYGYADGYPGPDFSAIAGPVRFKSKCLPATPTKPRPLPIGTIARSPWGKLAAGGAANYYLATGSLAPGSVMPEG